MTADIAFTPGEVARCYASKGWSFIPVPFMSKIPILKGWERLRLTEADSAVIFDGQPQNVGVLLGAPSNGLIDVDLDAPETAGLATHFLERTRCRFGRLGNPDSHWLYAATPCGSTTQFEDIDGTMLVEYRSTGAQTVFPGSVHPSGEKIQWVQFEDPLPTDGRLLKDNLARLATATLFARHWPTKGSRQKAALALARGLLRAGWQSNDVENFIHAVGIGAGDEELSMREKAADYTNRKVANNDPVTGWPTLAELVADKVVDKACQWLGVGSNLSDDRLPNSQKSQATRLVDLVKDIELWHTPDLDAFATVPVGEHKESWPLNSRGFRQWLTRRYYEAQGKTPSAQALQDSLSVLGGMAVFDGGEHSVYTRLAEHNGAVYLDLASDRWEAVEITSNGWRVVSDPPVKFRRPRGMLPLPAPAKGDNFKSLRRFVNVSNDDDWILLLAWLIAALRPQGPYPVLVLHGEQGSAKSTLARVLRALLDPNKASLRSEPRDARDLIIAATNGWCIALDNLSHIAAWLSDAICRLATGGGFGTRTLYENAEETLFDAQRPVILNGITELATRGDLLDRSIIIYLPSIPKSKRRPEADFWQDFEAAHPGMLGAVLDAVSVALRNVDGVSLHELPRMADFALWGMAAESKLGAAPGSFIKAYTGNRESANELALESSPVVPPLREVAAELDWAGTSTELLKALDERVDDKTQRQKGWPSSPRTLSNVLRRLAPNLRATGIDIMFSREAHTRRRLITIRKDSEFTVPIVPDVSETGDDGNDTGTQVEQFQVSIVPRNRSRGDYEDDGDAEIPAHSKKGWGETF